MAERKVGPSFDCADVGLAEFAADLTPGARA